MLKADKSSLYWLTNEKWYFLNPETHIIELTEEATPEAVESFILWKNHKKNPVDNPTSFLRNSV